MILAVLDDTRQGKKRTGGLCSPLAPGRIRIADLQGLRSRAESAFLR